MHLGPMSIDWHHMSIYCMIMILEKYGKFNYENRLIQGINQLHAAKKWEIGKGVCKRDWCQSINILCKSINASQILKNF